MGHLGCSSEAFGGDFKRLWLGFCCWFVAHLSDILWWCLGAFLGGSLVLVWGRKW